MKPARYLPSIHDVMIAAAEAAAFPLIELPPDTSFNDILHPLLSEILSRQAYLLKRSEEIHSRFTAVALAGGDFREIACTLAEIVRAPVSIEDGDFGVLACAIPEGTSLTERDLRVALEGFWHEDIPGISGSHFRKETALGGLVVNQFIGKRQIVPTLTLSVN